MNRKMKLVTVAVSLSCVAALTLVTNYVVTQIPFDDATHSNIDAFAPAMEVNAFDARGTTPLMQAAIDSDFERAKILLSQGADPNIRSASSDKDYALNYAIFNGGKLGSLAVAELLIENGADVNLANARGMAPIHFMMQITNVDNRQKILNDLMARGAHINAQNEDGSTMLHITVTNWDNGWIDRLNLEYGQILNYNIMDKKNRTPLALAIELGHVSVNGAESVENSLRNRPTYIGDNFNIKAQDPLGRTGLGLAILRSDMKFVSALVGHGADLAHQDLAGNSPMHYAVTTLDPVTYVNYLIQAHAPLNIRNNLGETPLFNVVKISSSSLRRHVARLLINAGSPIANRNNAGRTVIDLARAANDKELTQLLAQELEKRKEAEQEKIINTNSRKFRQPKVEPGAQVSAPAA